jgi:hypothetical protein
MRFSEKERHPHRFYVGFFALALHPKTFVMAGLVPATHMWTALGLQGRNSEDGRIACDHMSGI